MAEERVIELSVDATQADKALKKFGGTLEDVHGKGAQPLNFAIGELEDRLYEMASAGKQNTAEFKEMAKEVGRMKKTIIDTDLAIDAMSQTMSQNVGGALQGVAGGFTLAQGAMGAFGAGGEAVEEALLKVQSAMAISDGIQSIREGIMAFKAMKQAIMANTVVQKVLNVVMSLNPIGLIVAAVAALGAAIYALWEPIKQLLQFFGLMEDNAIDIEAANKKVTAEYERQLKAMKAIAKQAKEDYDFQMKMLDIKHKRLLETMEEEGATADELDKERRKQIEERFKLENKELDRIQQQRQNEFNLNKDTIDKQMRLYRAAKRQGEDDRARELKDSIQKKKTENEGLLFEIRNHHKNVEILKEEHVDNLDNIEDEADAREEQRQQERLDKYKEYLSNRISARRRIQALELELMQEGFDKERTALKLKLDQEIEDLKANTQLKADEKATLEKLLTEKYTRELNAITLEMQNEFQENVMEARQPFIEKEIENSNALATAMQASYKNSEEEAKNSLATEQSVQEAKFAAVSRTIEGINGLVQAFAGQSEEAQRRAFNINKAVNIANAVMNTATAITKVFAETTDFTPTQSFRIANAVSIGVAGAAQVAAIARTQFQGSGGASGITSSIPQAIAAPPQFNVVGDTGVNQLAQTLGQQNGNPIKAYVVGQDVTNQQSLDRNIQNTASL